MAEELSAAALAEILGTGGERLTVAGRELLLRPFTLAQIAEALEVVDRMSARGAVTAADVRDFNPLRVLLRGGRDVLDLLRIATGQEAGWLGALDPAEGAKLVGVVWRVNSDFFTRNRETIEEALGALGVDVSRMADAVAAKIVGLLLRLLSSSSSPEDTASQTSGATPSVS